jgi:hypothetical protein
VTAYIPDVESELDDRIPYELYPPAEWYCEFPFWKTGKFNYSNGVVTGRFVEFLFDEQTAALRNYTVKFQYPAYDDLYVYEEIVERYKKEDYRDGINDMDKKIPDLPSPVEDYEYEEPEIITKNITVFDTITVNTTTPTTAVTFRNAFLYIGDTTIILARDTPAAKLAYGAFQDITVTYNLAANYTIIFTSEHHDYVNDFKHTVVWFEGNGLSGHLIVIDGEVDISNTAITVQLHKDSVVRFTSTPVMFPLIKFGCDDKDISQVEKALKKGQIGVALSIYLSDGEFIKYPIINRKDITVTEKIEIGRVEVKISSDNPAGTIVQLNLDRNTMPVDKITDITVKFDGVEIESVSAISNLLYSESAKFYATIGSEGIMLLVQVPHFSEHIITVEYTPRLKTLNIFIPLIAACAVLAGAVILLLRKKRAVE